jgi:hypothetical protein
MRGPARCHVVIQVPTLADCVTFSVACSDTIGTLISRALVLVGLPDPNNHFHLYGLNDEFTAFSNASQCASLFLSRYRSLTLLPYKGERITVLFEGRRAAIDVHAKSFVGDLLSLAAECFNLPLASGGSVILFDPKRLMILRSNDEITGQFLVLKRANLFGASLVFTSVCSFDQSVPIFTMAKLLFSHPMNTLFSSIRSNKVKQIELVTFSEDRLNEVFQVYRTEGLREALTQAEMNSLLFLLLGLSHEPLLSLDLRRRAAGIMDTADDATRYEQLVALVALLPLESHAVIAEVALTYASVLGRERQGLVELLRELLFGEDETDRERELLFVSFTLLCSQRVFSFPSKPGRELKLHGQRFVLFEAGTAVTFEGPSTVDIAEATALGPAKDVETILRKWWRIVREPVVPPPPDVDEIMERVNNAYERLEGKPVPMSSLRDFDFDGLF